MDTKEKDEIIRILENHICGSLSTVNKSKAYCNTIYYCFDKDLCLYFASDYTTKHADNIMANPNVAVCVWDQPSSYGQNIGLQIEGECHLVSGINLFLAWSLYIKRFNIFQQKIGSFENLRDKIVGIRLYKIEPKSIKITNSSLFGNKAIIYDQNYV